MYEIEAIEKYKPEYNLNNTGASGTMPEITRQRISASNKGRVGPMKGKKFTDEHRENLRAALTGLPHYKARGVPFTLERRRKISDAAKGRVGPTRKAVVCLTDGRTYASVLSAAAAYRTSPGYVSLVARGLKASIKGLTFKFRDQERS